MFAPYKGSADKMTATGSKQALFERVGNLRTAIQDVRDGQRDAWDTINELTDFLQEVPDQVKSLYDGIAPSSTERGGPKFVNL